MDQLTAQARERSEAAAKARIAEAKAAADSFAKEQAGKASESGWISREGESLGQRDARLAAEIRVRAEAEAKRKMESGNLSSGPGGSGVKVSGSH